MITKDSLIAHLEQYVRDYAEYNRQVSPQLGDSAKVKGFLGSEYVEFTNDGILEDCSSGKRYQLAPSAIFAAAGLVKELTKYKVENGGLVCWRHLPEIAEVEDLEGPRRFRAYARLYISP